MAAPKKKAAAKPRVTRTSSASTKSNGGAKRLSADALDGIVRQLAAGQVSAAKDAVEAYDGTFSEEAE